MKLYPAPFETFAELAERESKESPYDEAYISRCRNKALEYSKHPSKGVRTFCLNDLEIAVPCHYRDYVFAGIIGWKATV
jgi:hypothetical protein